MKLRNRACIPAHLLYVLLLNVSAGFAADDDAQKVAPGTVVSLTYTVTLPDGEVVNGNAGGDPIKYKQGSRQLLPALESALDGLTAGEKTTVTLPPEDAYPLDKNAFRVVPLDSIPQDMRRIDAVYRPKGARSDARVADIREDQAVLDFNHPLAGKTLTYDITILLVE